MREWFDSTAKREILRSVAGVLFTAGLMALLGPFGTFAMPVAERALYWLLVIGLIWPQSDLVTRALERSLNAHLSHPRLIVPVLSAAVVALPATAVVVVVTQFFLPEVELALFALLGQVFLVLAVFGVAFNLIEGASTAPAAGVEGFETARSIEPQARPEVAAVPGRSQARDPKDIDAEAAFRARYPDGLTGRLLCLEMEDHYLRIHTERGSGIILMRMGDAERELGGAEGMRVHRSWWVASAAVRQIRKEGARLELLLENAMVVPVGKTYRSALRKAGWLNGAR
ncbi:MAG: LytTR family transcriptional regulator [Pararhodobacter sp.]|nr:LytTR family transcriptional regulator [Pararhodobacter sp.]